MNLHTNLVDLGLIVSDNKIFKNFTTWLPWQPEFCLDSNSLNNFQLVPLKNHSCKVWSKLAQWFRRSCQLLTEHGRLKTDAGLLAYYNTSLSNTSTRRGRRILKFSI